MTPAILGAVLAGGASSRFGTDKALALLEGRTLLDRACAAVAPMVAEVVIVGRGAVADVPRPGLGPIGGIAGALAYAGERRFASVLTLGCDMPDVPDTLLIALAAQAPAYCADAPVLGHWPATLADALAERLAAAVPGPKDGRLSVRRWAAAIGARAIPSPVPLRNVNTPADLLAS